MLWFGFGLASLALFAAALVVVLDTGPGRRFVADQIQRVALGSGLRMSIGRIEGSIYGRMTLRDVRLSDTEGMFADSPELTVDWRPAAWLANRLQINEFASPLIRLHRLPKLAPSERKDGAILPSFDIRVAKLQINRLWFGPRVAGEPRSGIIIGEADIRSGRALIQLAAKLRDGDDRFAFILDAEPDRDRFDLDAGMFAPSGGLTGRLLGLKQAMELRVTGDGSWQNWTGKANARVDDLHLLDLTLVMSKGQFDLSGTAAPTSLLSGKLQRLTAPRVFITSAAKLEARRLDLTASLRSAAIQIDSAGMLNLAESSFEGFSVNAVLLKPEALFPNMSGRDIRLRATVAGPFSAPTLEYTATSPFVAFDNTGFEQARLSGRATLVGDRKTIPVTFTARRVTGAGVEAEDILRNLRVDGPLFLQNNRLFSDRLAVRSDKVNGRGGLTLDLRTGVYAVMLDGKLNRYLIPGIGIVDVETRLKVVPGAPRGSMLTGTAKAWVRRLDNAFFRSITGGLPVIETSLARGPDRVIRFSNTRLSAPEIQLSGAGLRRTDGSFRFEARGRQDRYGALELDLDGPLSRPRVDLLLARPHLGAGLANVSIQLLPQDDGWRYTADGQSILGPFNSNGRLLSPPGQPFVIDVARLSVGGTTSSGVLRSATGGFSGTLALSGGGVSGQIALRPVNGVQRIDAELDIRRARFPGPPSIFIGRGSINAMAMLYPSGPTVNATVNARRLRYGRMLLSELTGSADIANGAGNVNAKLAGTANIPFSFDAKASFSPESITIGGSGSLENQPIRLVSPAVLAREKDDWVLRQVRVEFAGGTADLSGRWGHARMVDAKLNDIGLSMLNLFNPELGLSGRASGTISYSQAARGQLPKGRVALTVRNLSRAGLALTSTPFDLGVAALLDGRVGALRGVIRSKGQIVGRAQGRITPIPGDAEDPLLERLFAAPLFAQLRYNGPAEALWRLTGIETLDVSGPAAIAADIGGRFGEPEIRGVFRTSAARVESRVIGAVANQIKAEGRFNGSRLVIPRFTGVTPNKGSVSGNAVIELSAETGFGLDVLVNAENARVIDRDDLRADVTGPIRLKSDSSGGLISGKVRVDRARFRLGRAAAAAVPRMEVREVNRIASGEEDEEPARPWKLDIEASGRNQLMVTGLGLDSEWRADLQIGGDTNQMAISGTANLVRGAYEFAGKRFELTRGQIRFTGEYPPDPTLDIAAEANVQGLSATIRVTGTGLRPEITFASIPALPEDEVLSRLLFGTSVANLSAPEALQLAAAAASLRSGGRSAGNPLNKLGRAIGVDRIRVLPGNDQTGQGTTVAAGKYIGKRVYVEVASDAQGYSATQIEVELTRWLSVLSRVSTLGETSVNVKVSRDY
ncbi:hypothetical protein BSL82_07315 [Tardibacter chloracetimidivorans]|uniref:Translocation and assembly module TamB C-terminal domain-containing protein n=1 Tax=Tardibacter chloracetimidivorans TaxID=1921510 RepID=A0A1L3ZZE7_9SPHN|nr:hypothetical protein BSL82_07315 [Tardibacter chloracetimidivorans]